MSKRYYIARQQPFQRADGVPNAGCEDCGYSHPLRLAVAIQITRNDQGE